MPSISGLIYFFHFRHTTQSEALYTDHVIMILSALFAEFALFVVCYRADFALF